MKELTRRKSWLKKSHTSWKKVLLLNETKTKLSGPHSQYANTAQSSELTIQIKKSGGGIKVWEKLVRVAERMRDLNKKQFWKKTCYRLQT